MAKRGSAIIIAIFLLAAVGSLAFGIGRLFFLDSNLAGMYENSAIAYYAAESGIEEGMLRYRYDKNQELPVTNDPAGPVFDSGMMELNSLNWANRPDRATTTAAVTVSPDPVKHFYGLQMSYLGPYYGFESSDIDRTFNSGDLKQADYETQSDYYLPKDEAIKIDVTAVNADVPVDPQKDVHLYLRIKESTCNPANSPHDTSKIFVEAKVTGTLARGGTSERKVALVPDTTATTRKENLAANISDGEVYIYSKLLTRIRDSKNEENGITSYAQFAPESKVELSLKAVGCGFYFGLKPLNAEIAQPYTTLKSTGYYGGVTRTLEAKIDRQAGTVYDLFDYVLYDRDE